MIIRQLKLENYRRFANLYLEFPENIVGLIGRNGAGKSTIIEAIGWALYGNTIARTEKQEIRSQFLSHNQACKAELTFAYGDHEYKIIRILKGKNAISEAAIYRDGGAEPAAVQERGVNQFVEELLKLDRQSFLTSVFARQKDLDALSSMRPEDRRKSINRLINIDLIDKARERVRRDRNDKRNYIDGKASLLKDEKELKEHKGQISAEIKSASAEKADLQKRVEQTLAELKSLKQQLDSITKLRDLYNQWQLQIGKLESRLDENRQSLGRSQNELKVIAEAENEFSQVKGELEELDPIRQEFERLNEAAAKHSELQGHLKNINILQQNLQKETDRSSQFQEKAEESAPLQTKLNEIESEISRLETEIKRLLELQKQIHSEKHICTRKGKETKARLEKIEALGTDGECPVCTQRLGDHYQHVSDNFKKEIKALRSDYVRLDGEEKQLEQKLRENEKQLGQTRTMKDGVLKNLSSAQEAEKNLLRSRESVENYQAQIERGQKEIKALGEISYNEKRHNEIKEQYNSLLKVQQKAAQLEERISRKETVEKDLFHLKSSITKTGKEIKECRKKQGELDYDEARYQGAQEQVERQSEQLDKVKDDLGLVLQQLARLTKEKEQIDKEIREQKKIRAELEKEKEAVEYLTLLEETLGNFRLDLASRIRPLIAQRASELLGLTTNGRYNLLQLDLDYNIQLYDGNEPFRIERFSGGEQDLANLCLRIAISQVVADRSGGSPINLIVLDEIFGSQDLERRDLILYALGRLSNYFRQIFIITHIEQVRDLLPVIVDVRQTNDQQSEALFV